MYLHKTKNGHYTPPCCYFSGELEVVEILRVGFCCKASNFRLYKRYADQRIVVRPAYIAYGAVMASREQDGEPEATGTGRDKEL